METNKGNNDKRKDLAARAGLGAIGVGSVLLLISLLLPPPGKIDHSVLVAFGEICTFAGAVFGIGTGVRTRKTEIE